MVALSPEDGIAELRDLGPTPPALDVDRNNHLRSVSATPDAPLPPVPGAPQTTDPVLAAASFVNRYGQAMGLAPGQQAAVDRVDQLPGGDRVVRLQQRIAGLPVIGGDLVVAVNPAGAIVSAGAETPVDQPTTVATRITAADAAARAVAAAAQDLGAPADLLAATDTSTWLFDPRLLGAPGRPELRSTWWVKVGALGRDGELASVFVDATDGSISLVLSERQTARKRLICDLANAPNLNIEGDFRTYDCGDPPGGPPVVRREGQGPVGIADVDQAYDLLGAVYDYYLANFGRDSIDGHGLPLRATVRACQLSCPYPNAFWDGVQMVFGPGFAGADDVVGHELTHGVTSHTSDLYYFSESGGINEALSDIMGEFIDQGRGTDDDSQWLLGEDTPFGAIRSMKSPNVYNQPERVGGLFWDQAFNDADDGYGVHGLSGVVNKAAHLLAVGGTLGGDTVVGIGLEKSAQIWYRLQFMLPSGANMLDLATLLPAACRSVIGLRGITAANCGQAQAAVNATDLNVAVPGFTEELPCPAAGMPARQFYREDFERGYAGWVLDPGWWRLPSPEIPVSWANSGKNALLAFRPPFNTDDMRAQHAVQFPTPVEAAGSIYMSWNENITTSVGSGWVGVDWLGVGSPRTSYSFGDSGFSHGYRQYMTQLGNLVPGSSFRVVMGPAPTTSAAIEWLVDDISVHWCMANLNGAPEQLAGELSADRTTANLSWSPPRYLAPGNGPASYEITFLPAVDGSPNPIIVPATQHALTVNGLDPDIRYAASVRVLNAAGQPGPGTTVYLPGDGVFACPPTTGAARDRPLCAGTPPPAPR